MAETLTQKIETFFNTIQALDSLQYPEAQRQIASRKAELLNQLSRHPANPEILVWKEVLKLHHEVKPASSIFSLLSWSTPALTFTKHCQSFVSAIYNPASSSAVFLAEVFFTLKHSPHEVKNFTTLFSFLFSENFRHEYLKFILLYCASTEEKINIGSITQEEGYIYLSLLSQNRQSIIDLGINNAVLPLAESELEEKSLTKKDTILKIISPAELSFHENTMEDRIRIDIIESLAEALSRNNLPIHKITLTHKFLRNMKSVYNSQSSSSLFEECKYLLKPLVEAFVKNTTLTHIMIPLEKKSGIDPNDFFELIQEITERNKKINEACEIIITSDRVESEINNNTLMAEWMKDHKELIERTIPKDIPTSLHSSSASSVRNT